MTEEGVRNGKSAFDRPASSAYWDVADIDRSVGVGEHVPEFGAGNLHIYP